MSPRGAVNGVALYTALRRLRRRPRPTPACRGYPRCRMRCAGVMISPMSDHGGTGMGNSGETGGLGRSLLGEFRRTAVLVPTDSDNAPLVGDFDGIRWIYAFSNESALARFAIARGEGGREWPYQRLLGARLWDATTRRPPQPPPAPDRPAALADPEPGSNLRVLVQAEIHERGQRGPRSARLRRQASRSTARGPRSVRLMTVA